MSKYLGVDFGLKRIGLSLSEGELASPFKIIEVKSLQDSLNKIEDIAEKESVEYIIVGFPEGQIGRIVGKFVKLLQNKGLNVSVADETLSSKHAMAKMIKLGISKDKRRRNDDFSAAEILQNYLDEKS